MSPRRRSRTAVEYPRDSATAERIAAVAEGVDRRYGVSRSAARWRPLAVTAETDPAGWPVLALDDYSKIPFVAGVVGVAWYQYRARLRCGDDDHYAVSRPVIRGYEEYNREYLGLGRATRIGVDGGRRADLAIGRALRDDPASLARIRALARRRGGMLLHPYMGIEPIWELGEVVQRELEVPVRVLAPPPRVTRLANDKACLSVVVRELLGADHLARTFATSDRAAMAEGLRAEVERSDAVALKMPSCASGMGNQVYDSRTLRGKPLTEFHSLVDRFLAEKEWDGEEPVLVVEWLRDVLESPSTQCWIPPLGAGEPVVEEVFQQFLSGTEQVFEGAMLSGLPRRIRHELMASSWLVCRVFQALGYVGRCSFDALVVGRTLDTATVKFVECNGRWGGTSTPMHLMTRVFGDFRRVPYKAQDYVDPRLRGLEFPDLMDLFGVHLFDRRTGRGRALLYNVGGITEHGKFDLAVSGRSFGEVQRFITDRVPVLVSRYLRGRRAGRSRGTS